MAEDTEDININLNTNIPEQSDASINSLKGLKTAYKEAMSDMAKGTKGAAERVADLEGKLGDLKDQMDTVKGSGVEKLTSSMNLLKDGFRNADPGKLGIAMRGLGAAMKTIPLFLLIEGIMWLIENFEKLSKGGGALGKVFTFIGDIIKAYIQVWKDLADWLGLTSFAADEAAERQIAAAKATEAATTERYDAEIKMAKAAGKETIELEIKKQQAIIDSAKTQFEVIKALAAANGEVTEAQMEKVSALGKVVKDAQFEIDIIRTTAETKATNDAKKGGEEKKIAEDNAKKSIELQQKIAEDAIKQREEDDAKELAATESLLKKAETLTVHSAEAQLALNKKRAEEEIDALLLASGGATAAYNASVKAKLDIEQTYQTDLATLKKKATDDAAAEKKKADDAIAAKQKETDDKAKAERDKQNKEIIAGINSLASSAQTILSAISDYNQAKADEAVKVNEEALTAQLGSLEVARNEELNQEGLTAEQKVAIENKYKKQKYDLELAEYNNSTKIKKKAFEQDKKMKIAMSIISTITGAISAFTGMLSIPIYGIALGVIAAAAVVAAGALNIAKIQNTTFDAGTPPAPITATAPSMSSVGAGMGGGENSSASSTPSFDLFKKDTNQNGANNNASNNSSNQPPVVRAYVVSQEITDQQTANNYSTSMGTL